MGGSPIGHISRYVGNWAGSGFSGVYWELAYNDAIRTIIDERAQRRGQLARRYLIPTDSHAGSSTAAIWGDVWKMEEYNCRPSEMRCLFPDVADYAE